MSVFNYVAVGIAGWSDATQAWSAGVLSATAVVDTMLNVLSAVCLAV